MNTQIYEEATGWLIKHREADFGSQERRAFDAWMRESPQHVRAYLEMSALWEDVPALDASWNPTPEELIARVRGEANIYPLADTVRTAAGEPRARPRSRDSGRPGIRFFAVAAAFVMAAVAVTTWYQFNRNTYATDIGEQRSIALTDGSVVELNSRSRVRIRYTDSRREIDLVAGQALFRVAHDATRPFVVNTGTANVRAVGTQFDVYKKRSGTVVTVVEGRVAILANVRDAPPLRETTAAVQEPFAGIGASVPRQTVSASLAAAARGTSHAIFLAAGEQLTVRPFKMSQADKPSAADSPQPVNVAATTAWTHRTLVFESAPLADVAEEFNRYNTRQLVVTDPTLAGIHISGMFSSVDPALLLKFLNAQPELHVLETETEIRISKR